MTVSYWSGGPDYRMMYRVFVKMLIQDYGRCKAIVPLIFLLHKETLIVDTIYGKI